ncbi:30S ribosome-binding factor RbfA [Acidisphaera sp. L21]|uniref:30S ribosome-binding factor RbfA n=1 Tax=Acidisphaera sp. L21 TaxID=1641851 RepID=UPI00131CC783|nr:30S ribosome-binding factor RbfA [Acidisphaera sp. L21]
MSRANQGATQGAPAKRKPKRAPAGPTQRQLRVAEEIRHLLSAIFLRGEFRDPALSDIQVTVTEVRISPDLKNATAFVTRLGRSDVDLIVPALTRAVPYLRSELAKGMRLRIVPGLSFQPDTALEYAMHVEDLLHRPDVLRDLKSD